LVALVLLAALAMVAEVRSRGALGEPASGTAGASP
jgi:hypothetical protein